MSAPLRVAIVGLGPKGLFALERLLDHASALTAGAGVTVDVFEPHRAPGAGPNYDPSQPAYLRMNIAAPHLDMWWPANRTVPSGERPSFETWRAGRDPRGARDPFPPRALVGHYLEDGLATILRHTPPGARVALRAERVRDLTPAPGGWDLRTSGGGHGPYDEVLVTTGHARSWEGGLSGAGAVGVRVVPSVFPVTARLSPEHVPAGARVAVRGFALTFIDAALALTEGRGGRFVVREGSRLLRYEPHPDAVGTILPFSRTGRTMLAKPEPGMAADQRTADRVAGTLSAIRSLPQGFDIARDLAPILADAARDLLAAAAAAAPPPTDTVREWLLDAVEGETPPDTDTVTHQIEHSILVAVGARPPGLPWALGQAWRSAYPAIVSRLGLGGIDEAQWPAFARLAASLEPLAFGPPPVNAAKLLALIGAGCVDLSRLTAGPGDDIDVVVDAVLAPPGVPPGEHLTGNLVRDGYARRAPARRGVEVHADGRAVGIRGATPGLSILGRPTEDWIIGNDTLTRGLHPGPDLWAARVVADAVARHARARPDIGAAA